MASCSICHEPNPEKAKFCLECGAPLYPTGEARVDSRRRVTVVFSDLEGSTALGERLDPETVRAVLQRYFAEMRAVIEHHGGTVEKFIGDAVMAVFGIPTLHEDDALRAVRAALQMRSAQEALNEELDRRFGVRLRVRTGVNTGEVVAADPATGQTFATGDAVNVAARLEQHAAAGEILISADTQRLVHRQVGAEAMVPLALKGKQAAVPAFRLVDVRDERTPEAGASTQLVGRERELGELRDAFFAAVTARRCGLATVVGEPGVGKSRLVDELAAALRDDAVVLRGRCLSYGAGAFWPLAEIVRDVAQINAGDPAAVAREKIARLVTEDDDGAVVGEIVAALIGLSDTAIIPAEAAWAVRRLLWALAADRPLVVVIDDLHWSETALVEILREVVTSHAEGRPMLVLCLGRPEVRDVAANLLAEGSIIALAPLDPGSANQLAAALLGGGLPELVARRITSAAEGNPLFVQELLRMWLDDGTLQRGPHGWHVTTEPRTLSVPATLEALLAARLDRLHSPAREVTERASVVGEEFARDEVAELLPEARRDRLDTELGTLVRQELLRPSAVDAFRFAHVLIRDVAYHGMLKELRAELHERFADWLELRLGERLGEYEAIVGHHLEQAYRYREELAPVGAADRVLARRAARRLISTGSRAVATVDRAGALSFFQRAAALCAEDDPLHMEALLEAAEILRLDGEHTQADEIAARVLVAARRARARDLELRAEIAARDSWQYSDPQRLLDEGDEPLDQLATELERAGDFRGLSQAYSLKAFVLGFRGDYGAAEKILTQGIEHARAAGNASGALQLQVRLYMMVGWGPTPSGEAMQMLRSAMADARTAPFAALIARGALALIHAYRGDFAAARRVADEVAETQEKLDVTHLSGHYSQIQGLIELLAGDARRAERHLRRGYDVLVAFGEEGARWTVATLLAEALLAQDRDDEAEGFCDLASAHAAAGDRLVQLDIARIRAMIFAGRGQYADAESWARTGLAIAATIDNPNASGNAYSALARALATDRPREAREAIEQAIRCYEAKETYAAAQAQRTALTKLDG